MGPQFDDPEQNYPPFIVSSDPGEGEIFTPGQNGDRDISVTLADQNLRDRLFVRWLVDYPSSDPNTGRKALELEYPPSGMAVRGTVHFVPSCIRVAPGASQHRLVLSVSDRRFLDAENGDSVSPDAPFDSVPVGANRIRVVWLLNMDCK